ncbi:MAG: RecX family transcriptional regulator [Patescibacteria group bacterium]
MDSLFQKALSLAYFFLKFRPRTKQEIVRYLEKKSPKYGFSKSVIDNVILQLISENLIDDEKFIGMYVRDRNRFKPRSVFLLQRELLKLGISKNLLDAFFSKHDHDETALAEKLLSRRKYTYSRLDKKKRFQKSISYLQRKGFSYDIAKKVYQKIFEKSTEVF